MFPVLSLERDHLERALWGDWFPAPMLGSTQLPVALAPGVSVISSLLGTCAHVVYTHRHAQQLQIIFLNL